VAPYRDEHAMGIAGINFECTQQACRRASLSFLPKVLLLHLAAVAVAGFKPANHTHRNAGHAYFCSHKEPGGGCSFLKRWPDHSLQAKSLSFELSVGFFSAYKSCLFFIFLFFGFCTMMAPVLLDILTLQ